jgi:hypothetical protein
MRKLLLGLLMVLVVAGLALYLDARQRMARQLEAERPAVEVQITVPGGREGKPDLVAPVAPSQPRVEPPRRKPRLRIELPPRQEPRRRPQPTRSAEGVIPAKPPALATPEIPKNGVTVRLMKPDESTGSRQRGDEVRTSLAGTKPGGGAGLQDCAGQTGHNFGPCPGWQRVSQQFQAGDGPGGDAGAGASGGSAGGGGGTGGGGGGGTGGGGGSAGCK